MVTCDYEFKTKDKIEPQHIQFLLSEAYTLLTNKLYYLTGPGDMGTSGVIGAVAAVVAMQAAWLTDVCPRPDIIVC